MELQINKVLPRVQPGTGKNMTYIKPDYTYVLSQIKIVDLGWFKGVRMRKKSQRRKRKTQLYWSRILREAGVRRSEAGTMG